MVSDNRDQLQFFSKKIKKVGDFLEEMLLNIFTSLYQNN